MLLLRVLLEAVGSCATALGRRFSSSGRLLRTVLLPCLEHLASPCPLVASAAEVAVNCICVHGGYGSLSR